jgi:hypothetical protein
VGVEVDAVASTVASIMRVDIMKEKNTTTDHRHETVFMPVCEDYIVP